MTYFRLSFSEIIKEPHESERSKTTEVSQDLNLGSHDVLDQGGLNHIPVIERAGSEVSEIQVH